MRRGKHRAQAESSERPLRRRAARIARPARVRMRSRKPWVFARRRLFGWKVRLVTRYSKTRWGSASSVDTRNATSDVVHDVPGRIWGHAEATELAVKRYVVRLPQVKPAGGQPAGRVGAALRPGAAEVPVHRIVHRCGRAASTCGSSSAPVRPGRAGSGSSTGWPPGIPTSRTTVPITHRLWKTMWTAPGHARLLIQFSTGGTPLQSSALGKTTLLPGTS